MKTHTFSVVVGTAACNAACPFCVSKMTKSEASKVAEPNWRRFKVACDIVEQARDGLVSVLLTGKGEPLLFPDQIAEYLYRMNCRFPLIDLQTNGILVKKHIKDFKHWRDRGLTLVCLSITHVESKKSNALMGITQNYDIWDTVKALKDIGLAVRLNCTMLKSGMCKTDDAERLINTCFIENVEQLTFREVTRPEYARDRKIVNWIKKEEVGGACNRLMHYLEMKNAVRLLELPHGAIVYDYNGQNVCVSNCLTGTTDPNDIRQIIFFPEGQIMYDWRYPGARIL